MLCIKEVDFTQLTHSFSYSDMEKTADFKSTTFVNKECIVEFQAFVDDSDDFIIKELAIMDLSTHVTHYFLFKPPHSFKLLRGRAARTNKWLMKHYHHIEWMEGFVDYSEVENIISHYCSKFTLIHTTGRKKAAWLQRFTSAQVNNFLLSKFILPDICDGFCLSIRDSKHSTSNCALLKIYKILFAMGKTSDQKDGGGMEERYIKESCCGAFHELYTNQRRGNTCKDGVTQTSSGHC